MAVHQCITEPERGTWVYMGNNIQGKNIQAVLTCGTAKMIIQIEPRGDLNDVKNMMFYDLKCFLTKR